MARHLESGYSCISTSTSSKALGADMASVALQDVSRAYGRHMAVCNVTLHIAQGEFVVLLGPSGCGKTTVLRMIAGFTPPTGGRILIGDEDVTHIPPRQRNIGMVFQNYALFPNMSVAENIAFGLHERGAAKSAIRSRVAEMLDLVRLADKGQRSIGELSGGQQQRVALARAIAVSPRLLLMDEPMAALDLKLRESMQVELRRIQHELGITTVLVTHDQQEAMSLADRVVIMSEGRVQQAGSAADLYARPENRFVADFIGKNNLLRGTVTHVEPGRCMMALENGAAIGLPDAAGYRTGERLEISIRPEQLMLHPTQDCGNIIFGKVEYSLFLGNVMHYGVVIDGGQMLLVESSANVGRVSVGERVALGWKRQSANVFRPAAA